MMERRNSKVWIDKVEDIASYDEIRKRVHNVLDNMKGDIHLPSEATICIKLNLCLLKGPETGATVDPKVVRALVEWLLERCVPKKIYLAESDATHLNAEMAFKILGWYDFFSDISQVKLINLSEDERVKVNGRYLSGLEMAKTMLAADLLISVAKLKTHTQQKITCIMKNQFGAIPYKYKVIYHKNLTQAIYDATLARIPDLSIVDGLISMEGNGPTNGIPRRTGLLLASNDPVSMDHFCARLMGFRPMTVPHLRLAKRHGLGNTRYQIYGAPPDPVNLRFRFLPKWKEILKKGIGMMQKGAINEEA
jgi:uncharacterized protein (DUF362 family)